MDALAQVRIREGALPGPDSSALAATRAKELPRGLGNAVPIYVERASGAIVRDIDGNQFIDFASGIAVTSVGASHPRVVQAVQDQAARFTHTCFLVTQYDGYLEVAQRLNRLTPGDHAKKTALFSTGAEAVENAVKIARTHTGRSAVIVLDHAFHGRTLLAGSMTAKYKPYRGAGPVATDIHRAPGPYPYRWPGGPERAAEQAFDRLTEMIETQIGADNVAAIVVEPVQGEGGVIVQPPGYLSAIRDFCTAHGIVMIADEIQAGLARTGAMFAIEHDGVVPDLITTAKALAAGMPLAAVTGRAEIMDAVAPGGLGGTYAGNPVACAAAIASLDVIVEEGLVERAQRIEEITRAELADAIDSPRVGEFRGRGAMLALEIVQPGGTRPDAATAAVIVSRCHERGLLVLLSGTYGNVIRLLPPLVIDEELLVEGMRILAEEVLRSDELSAA